MSKPMYFPPAPFSLAAAVTCPDLLTNGLPGQLSRDLPHGQQL